MRHLFNTATPWVLILALFTMVGCTQKIERSGIVVDRETNLPIAGVSIDFYLKHQTRDSLKQKVVTDQKGHFYISEKVNETQLFQVYKEGYIGHVNSLAVKNDTITLERDKKQIE